MTEIATRNRTSLRAHAKVGFQRIMTYSDAGEDWTIVAWSLADLAAPHARSA